MSNVNPTQRIELKKALDAFFNSPVSIQRVIKEITESVRTSKGVTLEKGCRIIAEVKGRVFSADMTFTGLVLRLAFWDEPSEIKFRHDTTR